MSGLNQGILLFRRTPGFIAHCSSGSRGSDAVVYGNASVASGPPGDEVEHPYYDGYPQGIHLGQDSALRIGAAVLGSAQLAADNNSAILCPATHADQYTDDSDAAFNISAAGDADLTIPSLRTHSGLAPEHR